VSAVVAVDAERTEVLRRDVEEAGVLVADGRGDLELMQCSGDGTIA